MTRRQGETITRMNERDLPYIVEIALPPNGFDVRTNREMVKFHRACDIRPRFGLTRNRKGQRYCFSDAAIAEAFRERFGRSG
jgi:hypothetical protein